MSEEPSFKLCPEFVGSLLVGYSNECTLVIQREHMQNVDAASHVCSSNVWWCSDSFLGSFPTSLTLPAVQSSVTWSLGVLHMSGAGCLRRLWMPHPWRHSRPGWMWLWSGGAHKQGLEPDDHCGPFQPRPFCDYNSVLKSHIIPSSVLST